MHLSSIQLACAALVAVALGAVASPTSSHHVARRSYNLECKGDYDAAIFARLHRICDDCFNLYHKSEVYTRCSKCFTSPYFKGCMKSLYQYDEKEQIDQMIGFVGKR